MPVWVAIILASVPGVTGLVVAIWRMGVLHNEVKTISKSIEPIPAMAEDIAFLKGVDAGKRQAAVTALTEQLTPTQRRKVAAAF